MADNIVPLTVASVRGLILDLEVFFVIIGNLVPNFTLSEMENKLNGEKITLIITPDVVFFAEMMQVLRNRYGKPINVNSWYRSWSYNKKVGGSPASAHLDGRAVDISNVDHDFFLKNWKEVCQCYGCIGGINLYDKYIHLCNFEDKFGYRSFVVRDFRSKR